MLTFVWDKAWAPTKSIRNLGAWQDASHSPGTELTLQIPFRV